MKKNEQEKEIKKNGGLSAIDKNQLVHNLDEFGETSFKKKSL